MVKDIITKGSESAALHKKLVVDARDILATDVCLHERPRPTPLAGGSTVYCHHAETA